MYTLAMWFLVGLAIVCLGILAYCLLILEQTIKKLKSENEYLRSIKKRDCQHHR